VESRREEAFQKFLDYNNWRYQINVYLQRNLRSVKSAKVGVVTVNKVTIRISCGGYLPEKWKEF